MHIFDDFKGFKHAEINLFNDFTLVIGPNGSGKSNVIEGIELLSFIAHGRPIHEIIDIGRTDSGLQVRGGLSSCPSFGQFLFTLSFSASIKFLGKTELLDYSVLVDPKNSSVAYEGLTVGNYKIFYTDTSRSTRSNEASRDIPVVYHSFTKGKNPVTSASSGYSIISQYKKFATKNKKLDECISLVGSISSYLKASFIFDPSPKKMRNYERIGSNKLSRDGFNLSSVLYNLKIGTKEDNDSLKRILDWVRWLPDEPYNDFEFIDTKLNDVLFAFKQGDNNDLVDARLLSDGTLRFLAVLTALETVDKGSRVIIEEFDNGLHPSRVSLLTKAIQECCSRKKLNVLVTTHNPATLNSLERTQLDGVVFCMRDKKLKTANLIRLVDLPRSVELLESGRLGDLVTERVIEKYFDKDYEKEHKENALDWLKKLQ